MSQTESRKSGEIIRRLNQREGVFAWKTHGSAFARAGLPDVFVLYRGRLVAVEIKVGDNEPSPIQIKTLEKLKAAGCLAFWSGGSAGEIVREIESRASDNTT